MVPKRSRRSKKWTDFSSPGVNIKAETELGNEKEDYSEPEGPYTDKPLAD